MEEKTIVPKMQKFFQNYAPKSEVLLKALQQLIAKFQQMVLLRIKANHLDWSHRQQKGLL